MVVREHGVAATPTFGLFLDGKKVRVWLVGSHLFVEERVCVQIRKLKGMNAPESRTRVDLLLYLPFPRRLILGCATSDQVLMIELLTAHPHMSLDLPSIFSLCRWRALSGKSQYNQG